MLAGRALAFAVLGSLAACGQDPILDRADELAEQRNLFEVADRDGAGPPPGGQPPVPAAPAAFVEPASVVLRGAVQAPPVQASLVRVDVFDGDQTRLDGPRPSVVAVQQLGAAGTFEIRVPAEVGQVWVGAFADVDGNGRPDPGEPTGWSVRNPIATSADVGGIEITLVVAP